MSDQLLECGRIVNTHGIRGEVKIQPWADSPQVLCALPALYLDGAAVALLGARVHKGNVIAQLDGVANVEQAMALKGKVVYLHRKDLPLPEGSFFLADLLGLRVVDEQGQQLGVLADVLSPSQQKVYVVRGARELLIPAVPQFILETSVSGG